MSRNEVKEKIQSIIDKLNDEKLLKALNALKGIEKNEVVDLQSDLGQVLKEDNEVLARLAK